MKVSLSLPFFFEFVRPPVRPQTEVAARTTWRGGAWCCSSAAAAAAGPLS